ncbi:MAG: hypothetical protein ABW060_19440 [Solirubrobacteraceae bacterium]
MARPRSLLTLVVALSLAAPATSSAAGYAPWPERLFELHAPQRTGSSAPDAPVRDVAETRDGTFMLATGDALGPGASLLALGADGTTRRLASLGGVEGLGGGTAVGIAADPRGGTLVAHGFGARVVRVGEDGGAPELLAGTGRAGFSGDGGPAVDAEIDPGNGNLDGIARMRDGSVVFTDTWNNRLRRIRPDGGIETVAGTGAGITPFSSCEPFRGDGGPATAATLCRPTDVLALGDGSLIVADSGFNRIRRIGADGRITTIAGNGAYGALFPPAPGTPATQVAVAPVGLAAEADGDILFTQLLQVRRLRSDGTVEPVLAFSDDTGAPPVRDFAGRMLRLGGGEGIDATREGGIAFAAGDAYYIAPWRTARTLVRIHGARVRRGRLTLTISAARAGTAAVRIRRADGRPLAAGEARVHNGVQRLRLRGSFPARPLEVSVELTSSDGGRAHDAVPLYLATRLSMAYVRAYAEQAEDESGLAGCRRFGARRIDCVYGTDEWCERAVSVALHRTGVLWTRSYRCTDVDDALQRDPEWLGPAWPIGAPDVL